MHDLVFSEYLSTLLNNQDKQAILDYIEQKHKMLKVDKTCRFWPIRKSNGLESFERIDVYVNETGLIMPVKITEYSSMSTQHVITSDQFMILQGFMLYVWNVNHGEENGEHYGFWAEQLDNAGVTWYVQNTAACVMIERANGYLYFRNLLKKHNIHIEKFERDVITAEYGEDDAIDSRPFVVNLFQGENLFEQERYPTETTALERAEDINRLKTADRSMI